MIYFISDPHGGERRLGIERYIEMRKEGDLLIILGDLGLYFGDSEENRRFTEYFLSLDFPIALVDGNHENHAFLNSFPEEDLMGGRVNRLTPHIVRLRRGNLFQIEGKSFLVMGGCKSSAKWKTMGLWYDGEEPSRAELSLAYENLARCGNRVDYILTHKYTLTPLTPDDPMTLDGFQTYVDREVSFRHWYAGHWHRNSPVDERHTIVYDQPLALS